MPYPGGKHGAGVYQRLINDIPPHDAYIACFAGHDAIALEKKPAKLNILMDLDPEPIRWWASADKPGHQAGHRWAALCQDGLAWLSQSVASRATLLDSEKTFVYLDPPYLMSTRTSGPMYRFEMPVDDHVRMLSAALSLQCNCMISGYRSDLYCDMLKGWRIIVVWLDSSIEFQAYSENNSAAWVTNECYGSAIKSIGLACVFRGRP